MKALLVASACLMCGAAAPDFGERFTFGVPSGTMSADSTDKSEMCRLTFDAGEPRKLPYRLIAHNCSFEPNGLQYEMQDDLITIYIPDQTHE